MNLGSLKRFSLNLNTDDSKNRVIKEETKNSNSKDSTKSKAYIDLCDNISVFHLEDTLPETSDKFHFTLILITIQKYCVDIVQIPLFMVPMTSLVNL